MPKVTYHANGDAEDVEAFGVKFSDGKSVSVSDDVAARLKGNSFFKVSKESAEKPPEEGLKASHNGGGRFVIKNGAETIKDGLTKEDAAVFNALSDEDKAEYVKA